MFMLVSAVTQAQYQNLTANGWRFANNYDPNAQALFTAVQGESVSIPNGTKTAVNNFFITSGGRAYRPKIKAFYGMIFGAADGNKFNWFDPQDADGSFRITWHGGWTHGAIGSTPNGTTGYANTHLVPSVDLTLNDVHTSYYSLTDNTTDAVEIGALNGSGDAIQLLIKFSALTISDIHSDDGTDGPRVLAVNTNSDAFFVQSRTTSTHHEIYKDGSSLATSTNASTGALVNQAIYFGARNNSGTADVFSDRTVVFVTIGDGLDDTDVSELTADLVTLLGEL